jgi:glycosyltransferase involved in cell wall biosynthesis
MQGTTKLSIALCTYNGSRFLPEQLQSYLDQHRVPDELIVCDDASTDDTRSIIEHFGAGAPFPVHLHTNDTNLGSTRNFEKAIRLCTGDLIFLSDQDDIWHPSKLRVIEDEFRRSDSVGLVFTDAELIDEESRQLGDRLWSHTFLAKERSKAKPREFYRTLWSSNVVTGATVAFRRDLVDVMLPVPLHIPHVIHDGWIALVASVFADVVFLDTPLISYRLHPGQQLGVTPADKPTSSASEEFKWTIGNLENQKILLRTLGERIRLNDRLATEIAGVEKKLDEYILHLQNRIELLGSGPSRIPQILREVASGRYRRFSRGVMSPLKDLVSR